MSFLERKAARKAYYENFVMGLKYHTCTACSGSGRYDSGGSPKCSACQGTGKVKERLIFVASSNVTRTKL